MIAPTMANAAPNLLIFVRDLMFSTRIIETAKEMGVPYKMIRKPELLMTESGQTLIIDLDQEGAIDAASAWRTRTGGKTIGFVSHVNTGAISHARAAGIDEIFSRGQFVQQIPTLLRK